MAEGEGKFVTLRFARARISRVVGRCRALHYAVPAWYFMVSLSERHSQQPADDTLTEIPGWTERVLCAGWTVFEF